MERLFKSLEELFETDSINTCWTKSFPDGHREKCTIEDWYEEIALIRLSGQVPERIQWQFDAVRNVLVYSWFSYQLRIVALFYSFSVVEGALRERLGRNNDKHVGLKSLLTEALEKGFLNDSGFHVPKVKAAIVREEKLNDGVLQEIEYAQIPKEELRQSVEYIEGLCKVIPRLRNSLAHGKFYLFPAVLTPIIVHSEIINMLFEKDWN